jgi:uncharacterized membrane protein
VAGVTALTFVGVCIAMAAFPALRSQAVAGSLAAAWLIGAPLWFWYEYFFIYRAVGGGQQDSFEFFKHGQQLAAAIWAGLAASLGAFAASDYAQPVSDSYECRLLVPPVSLPASQASPATAARLSAQDVQLSCTRAPS